MPRASNKFDSRVISSVTTTLKPTAANHSFAVRFSGIGENTRIVLQRAIARGDTLTFTLAMPTREGVEVDVRNHSPAGTPLLPADQFPDSKLISDGYISSAMLQFVATGQRWRFAKKSIQA